MNKELLREILMGEGKFNWIRPSKIGSFQARFRFIDELRGEMFFDDIFTIQGDKDKIIVTSYGSDKQRAQAYKAGSMDAMIQTSQSKLVSLGNLIKEGDKLWVYISFISPKINKHIVEIPIEVIRLEKNNTIIIYYKTLRNMEK